MIFNYVAHILKTLKCDNQRMEEQEKYALIETVTNM